MAAPEICPHCGSEVPPHARACPECGSCEQTGWSDEAAADGLNLPDDSFDYDHFVASEFGAAKALPRGIRKFWWWVAILVVAAFVLWLSWPIWRTLVGR